MLANFNGTIADRKTSGLLLMNAAALFGKLSEVPTHVTQSLEEVSLLYALIKNEILILNSVK